MDHLCSKVLVAEVQFGGKAIPVKHSDFPHPPRESKSLARRDIWKNRYLKINLVTRVISLIVQKSTGIEKGKSDINMMGLKLLSGNNENGYF